MSKHVREKCGLLSISSICKLLSKFLLKSEQRLQRRSRTSETWASNLTAFISAHHQILVRRGSSGKTRVHCSQYSRLGRRFGFQLPNKHSEAIHVQQYMSPIDPVTTHTEGIY